MIEYVMSVVTMCLFILIILIIPIKNNVLSFNVMLLICFVYMFLLISSYVWSYYFELDVLWIVLSIMLIRGNLRGMFIFICMNGILSILLLCSMCYGFVMYYVYGLYGKFGFFPFFILYFIVLSSCCLLYFYFDCYNKLCYWLMLDIICFKLCNSYFQSLILFLFIIFNFVILIVYIKNIISIKHILIVSSFIQLHFVVALVIITCFMFIFSYISLYSIASFVLIWFSLFCFSNITISSFSFLFDNLYSINNLHFIFILQLLVLFGFVPSFSFFFKFFAIILQSSYHYSNHSYYLALVLILFSSLSFLYQGLFLRLFSST